MPEIDVVAPAGDATQLDRLRARLRALAPVTVAFSGGADSSFLAWVANDTLGPGACDVVTAVSPSLATDELGDCRALDPIIASTASTATASTIVLGVNVDDLGDHRPGQRAAAERGAAFPLLDAGFTKADVRSWSRTLGLRTWDKPAAACLASRLPYGTEVTVGVLSRVDRAEAALHRLGYAALRVRHYDDTARIEVPVDDLATIVAQRDAVIAAVRAVGYRYVTLDLEGLRSGNLNAALDQRT